MKISFIFKADMSADRELLDLATLLILDLDELEELLGRELAAALEMDEDEMLLELLVKLGLIFVTLLEERVSTVKDGRGVLAAKAAVLTVISGAQKDMAIAILRSMACQFKLRFNCWRLMNPSSIKMSPRDHCWLLSSPSDN